jgi:hypothetical protein
MVVVEVGGFMSRRIVAILAICIFGLVAGCGGDTAASAPDPAEATTCGDLADKYVEITKDIIEQIGDRTDADMEAPPAELEASAEAWMNTSFDVVSRIADLCNDDEFDQLLCERKSEIEPTGEAGERFLRDNFPACSD